MATNIADAVPRLKRLLPRLRRKRIGVLGDLMLDRYLWGTSSRISPEAPVPIVDLVGQNDCLGGAGNVAANIAALGAKVEAFGVLGSEEAGRAVRGASVESSGVREAQDVTVVCLSRCPGDCVQRQGSRFLRDAISRGRKIL